ncbi:MAG: hypothetical protein ACT4PE_03365, partial [Candidatus Eiseniibacteriota bacterium]
MQLRRSRSTRSTLGRLFAQAAWLGTAAVVLAGVAHAATVGARIEFAPSDFRIETADDGTRVTFRGVAAEPGVERTEALPQAESVFFVPAGFEVESVVVHPRGETRIARGVHFAGGASPAATWFASESGGHLGGFRLHSVLLRPIRQEAGTGDLLMARSLDVELRLSPTLERSAVARQRRSPAADAAILDALRAVVANPDDLPDLSFARTPGSGSEGFAPEELPSVEGTAVDMVIVTTAALQASFQPLADWKTKKGVPTVVRT